MLTNSRKTILLATDQQRSVLNALDANRPHPIAYTPYGHRSQGNGVLSLLGFNGELPDPVTGCYLLGNGYRAFNPVLMRFNSPDSWSPFGDGGLNAYAYCAGDPLNKRDPTGHSYFFPKGYNPIKALLNLIGLRKRSHLAKTSAASTAAPEILEPAKMPISQPSTANINYPLTKKNPGSSSIDERIYDCIKPRRVHLRNHNLRPTESEFKMGDPEAYVNRIEPPFKPRQQSMSSLQFSSGFMRKFESDDLIYGDLGNLSLRLRSERIRKTELDYYAWSDFSNGSERSSFSRKSNP